MDPREMEALVQRLVQNPHDQDAITQAHQAGQSDPKSYALLLEKVGTATSDPAFACHWLTESANVWTTTLGDAHRAARALMIAIDRDPSQPTPAERLADLYREKGDTKALVALLERRAKALATAALHDLALRPQVAGIHEELGQLWAAPPLSQPKKAIESYKRAVEFDESSQFSIYSVRELLKAEERFAEAVPYFELEQRLVSDPERQIALYQDEGDVRKGAGDLLGAAGALRSARSLEGGVDPALKQQLATVILESVQGRQEVAQAERAEGAQLFVELSEEYQGEHGFSYALCALEIDTVNDRAMQLALYYGEQTERSLEAAAKAAAYLKANPNGTMAAEARKLVSAAAEAGGDDSLIEALAPAPGADANDQVQGLVDMAQAMVRKAKKNEAAAKFREVLVYQRSNEDAIGFLEPYLRQTRKFQELRDMLLAAARDETADSERRKGYLREVAGLCETQLRDAETAITALKELLAIDVTDEGARSQLKRLLEKGQQWDELANVMMQEAEHVVDVEARISLEKSLAKLQEQKRKDPVATGEAWARIAALAAGDEEAITTAVRYFEKAERPELAVAAITDNLAAIAADGTRAELLSKLGELRLVTADALGAGEAFAEAATLTKQAALWESAETAFVTAESWDQAATAIDERAQLTSDPAAKAKLFASEAEYLGKADDEPSAVLRLEQATELDAEKEEYAVALEERYRRAERISDLATYLLRRADKLGDQRLRGSLRKRAANIQRDELGDPDAARATLNELLEDGDDVEALAYLAGDAESRQELEQAVSLLGRLVLAYSEPNEKTETLLRQAGLTADGLQDPKAAIVIYERILSELDSKHDGALVSIAQLHERLDDHQGRAGALERRLAALSDPALKQEVAESLAQLYEGPLADPKAAVRVLDIVRELDPENFDAVQRLCELCEKLEDWPRVATFLAQLAEVEGDEDEVSKMIRRMAEILHVKVGKSDEALAALMDVADRGDAACRDEYVTLGDNLGWKGVVATKLVEWYMEAPVGPARNGALKGAFERFVAVGRDADAAAVAKELARTRGADPDIAKQLEEIAVKLQDLDALGIAHDLMVSELSGPTRAEEMVRQAEVLIRAGVAAEEAIQHGEQALTSVAPPDVVPLLERLAKLAPEPAYAIGIYERQVTRCKAPSDKLAALGRAASIAAEHGAYDKARTLFDIALSAGTQEETLSLLEGVALSSDKLRGVDTLRRTLADSMAAGGQGSRDGGRTRGLLLGRAAALVYRELKDVDKAFNWLGDAIVTHVDDERLDALEALARDIGDSRRAETVLSRALEEVFDGPLVRKLLARRATLRRDKLADKLGAAGDLKRLHDLSPSDTAVMDQLSELYVELQDYRGMVQLFEDQILRGKDPAARAELARKVARLWEEKLDDPRESADAWRRVLRMKAGDPEATEGLERAKQAMLKRPKDDSEPKAAPKPAVVVAPEAVKPPADVVAEGPTAVADAPPKAEESAAAPAAVPISLSVDAAIGGAASAGGAAAVASAPEEEEEERTEKSLDTLPDGTTLQGSKVSDATASDATQDGSPGAGLTPAAPEAAPGPTPAPAEVKPVDSAAAPAEPSSPTATRGKLAPPPKPSKKAAAPPEVSTAEAEPAPKAVESASSSTPPPLPGSAPSSSPPPLPNRNGPPPIESSARGFGVPPPPPSSRPLPPPTGAAKGGRPPPPPKGGKAPPPPPPGSSAANAAVPPPKPMLGAVVADYKPGESDPTEVRPPIGLADDNDSEFSVDDEELIDDQV